MPGIVVPVTTPPFHAELVDAYVDYCRRVSRRSMAINIETAAYLWWTCVEKGATRVLDLGSGFSSYVLRRYAESAGAMVTSVDDDPFWLDQTAQFLKKHGFPEYGLMTWDDWIGTDDIYDVIVHDFSRGADREKSMWTAAERLAPGGVLIFDDANNAGHRAEMGRVAAAHGFELRDIRDETVDTIGRHALLAIAPHAESAKTLAEAYERACSTPSDIAAHLPTFVALVAGLHAQHVIELGVRSGVSTVAWLHALSSTGGRLTSVDIDEAPPIGEYPNWTFLQGDDLDPAVVGQLDLADIVFIDTSHLYDHTRAELHTYLPLVCRGGKIVCHDTMLRRPAGSPRRPLFPVRAAIEEFVAETGLRWTEHPYSWGLGIIEVPG